MVLRRNTVQNSKGLYTDGKGLDKLDLGPIVTNQWMDFVCHVRWSTTSTNALRECWRDGQYMGGKTTRNAVAANTHELRVGQYQETNLPHHRTRYFDNVRIGTSTTPSTPPGRADRRLTTSRWRPGPRPRGRTPRPRGFRRAA